MIINCPSCSARFRVEAQALGSEGRSVRCSRCSYVWHQEPLPAEPPLELSDPLPDPPAPLRPLADKPFTAGRPPSVATGAVIPPPAVVGSREERGRFERSSYDAGGYPPPALPREIAPRDLPASGEEPRKGGLVLGWVLFFLVVGALLGSGWYWRDRIVAAVPELRKAYDWLGVPLSEAPPATAASPIPSPAPSPQPGEPEPAALAIAGFEIEIVRVTSGDHLKVTGQIVNRGATGITLPPLRVRVRAPSGQQLISWTFPAAVESLAPGTTSDFESARPLPVGTDPATIEVQVEFVTGE